MRLIDADALKTDFNNATFFGDMDLYDVCRMINKQPTIEPQRTGRWIDHVEDGYIECPFCHSATNCDDNISDLHFCFSCGARMEGE